MKIETLQHHWDSIEKNTPRGMSPEFKKALQERFFTGAMIFAQSLRNISQSTMDDDGKDRALAVLYEEIGLYGKKHFPKSMKH
jgi:hypothetical protein